MAVWRTSVSVRTLPPSGASSSGVSSTAPRRQRIVGIGEPTATHVRLTEPPGSTSTLSGAMEKWGGTRRTAAQHKVDVIERFYGSFTSRFKKIALFFQRLDSSYFILWCNHHFLFIVPAKAREYVFTGVSLCVCMSACLCVCLWPR